MLTPMKLGLAAIPFVLLAARLVSAEEKLTAEDVLRHHLDSIGPASIRSAAKSRVIEGTASYRVLVGGSGHFDGKAVMASEGNKLHILLKINAPQYSGEQFISDGERTSILASYTNQYRSELGNLLHNESIPLLDGLVGGVLTTAWPLLDLDAHRVKIQYEGLKKVDGTLLQVLTYKPRKKTGLEITLYFEPETFRHVRTIYVATKEAGLAASQLRPGTRPRSGRASPDVRSAPTGPTWWKIEEQFSDFKTDDGLTLPSHYDLRFQQQLQYGTTKTVEWSVTTTRVLNNVSVDAHNFEIR